MRPFHPVSTHSALEEAHDDSSDGTMTATECDDEESVDSRDDDPNRLNFYVLDSLLDRGADVNAANQDGHAPLHYAASMVRISGFAYGYHCQDWLRWCPTCVNRHCLRPEALKSIGYFRMYIYLAAIFGPILVPAILYELKSKCRAS